MLSLPVEANPNIAESGINPKIEGLTISAPDPALPGSKLFASKQADVISAVASADATNHVLHTLLVADVASNMLKAANGNTAVATTTAMRTETAAHDLSTLSAVFGLTPKTPSSVVIEVTNAITEKLVGGKEDAVAKAIESNLNSISSTTREITAANPYISDGTSPNQAKDATELANEAKTAVDALITQFANRNPPETPSTAQKVAVIKPLVDQKVTTIRSRVLNSIQAGLASSVATVNSVATLITNGGISRLGTSAIAGSDAAALAAAALAANGGGSRTDIMTALSGYKDQSFAPSGVTSLQILDPKAVGDAIRINLVGAAGDEPANAKIAGTDALALAVAEKVANSGGTKADILAAVNAHKPDQLVTTAVVALGAQPTMKPVVDAVVGGKNAEVAAVINAGLAQNLSDADIATNIVLVNTFISQDEALSLAINSRRDVNASITRILQAPPIGNGLPSGVQVTRLGDVTSAIIKSLDRTVVAATPGKPVGLSLTDGINGVKTAISGVVDTGAPALATDVRLAISAAISANVAATVNVAKERVFDRIDTGIGLGENMLAMAEAIVHVELDRAGTDGVALSTAALAARGLTTDGIVRMVGGGHQENVVAAALSREIVVLNDPSIDDDKARVIAASAYAANKSYPTAQVKMSGGVLSLVVDRDGNGDGDGNSDGVPPAYITLAGRREGAIAKAGFNDNVVDNAVKASGPLGTPLVKDVPVGNILNVIEAFDRAIRNKKDVESIAKSALYTDKSNQLTLEQAKIIAAAGMAAAQPEGTVAKAVEAGANMAKVLVARDAGVSAAAMPRVGETVTVPSWLINVVGKNTFPPTPLVDITGNSIPTDPTLLFDPPQTDATNPPLTSQKAAARMLGIVRNAMDQVSSTRAELGAIENRFVANIANLSNVVENVSAARSRIQDTDIAAATAELTKQSIMQQAGVAVLAQANQAPQLVLELLKNN